MHSILPRPEHLRDKIAQLLLVRIGSNMPPVRKVAEDADRIIGLLRDCPIGGLLLFNGAVDTTPAALEEIRAASRYPLLVASDIERGVGQQIRGATLFPHAAALAHTGAHRETLTKAFAGHVAREARAVGIDLCLGPVADLASNPENPIIATRAFSGDPETAACLVRLYVEGMHENGLLCVAKHFPGHGDTATDSHDEVPVVPRSSREIEGLEIPPFVAAIEAGVDGMMTAHVSYPALDPAGVIATGSRAILDGLLRKRLGFGGVVMSDSLLMAAVHDSWPTPPGPESALLAAGQDLLLDVADPLATVDRIERAIEADALGRGIVEAAFDRVWKLKQQSATLKSRDSGDGLDRLLPAGEALSRQIAMEAVTALSNTSGKSTAHLRTKSPLVLLIKPNAGRFDPEEEPLAGYLRRRRPGVMYGQIGPDADERVFDYWYRQAEGRTEVVVAMVVKPAAWHRFGLLPAQRRFVEELLGREGVTLVSLGVPEILETFRGQSASLCTFSDVPVSQEALAGYLTG